MFDLGFSELVVIAVVALIVLGPERLPKAARFAGLWIRRGRAQWHSVRSEFEREMAADELKRSLQDAKDAVRETRDSLRETGEQTRRELDQVHDAVRDAAKDADSALKPPAAATPAATAEPAKGSGAAAPAEEDGGSDGERR